MLPDHAIQLRAKNQHSRRPRRHRGLTSRATRVIQALVTLLCLVGLPLSPGMASPLYQDSVLMITYPTEGSSVSGQVPVQGTATHPNFVSYGVLYAAGSRVTGDTVWQQNNPIAWDVRSMVVNGVLGTWDTTQIPNGQYVLAVAMFEAGNETPSVHFVNNLTVNNEEQTPTPEPTATPEPGEAEPTQEAGPPPVAATIAQPPTSTPRPTSTLSPDETNGSGGTSDEESGGIFASGIFSIDAIKESFVLGAQLAFLIYAVGVLYVLAKAVIRYYLRQTKRKSS